ncbi:MAG: Ig-like domain-containing protein, partial [Candidatus Methanoperedens sp.]|nr:Ig-like domain-containing protein [Candidatus Methanoperedens sp.]
MNRKKISLGLLFLITALVVLPGASATPTYYGVLQSIYGGPTTCQLDCHTSTNGPPPFTTYGSLFSANASHFTDPTGVLKAIGPPLTSITVTPATAPLSVGGSQTFTAATLDPFGNSITATVTWTSSNTAVGTINPTTGVFTAVGAGTATITATGGGTGSGTITGNATATVSAPAPTLTLTLNTTVDGTSTPLVTNITSAVLLNTAGATVATATLPDTMTAQFSLSGITPGDYFIKVNGHAGALVPTRIDSTASSISQSVGLRLRNSVIGNISNPTLYRIKSYPSEIASSHAVVNYTTGLNETIYNFVIVSNSTSKIEVRVLGTDALMSSFSTTQINHDGYTDAITGLPVSFQIWILGDVKNPADPNGVAFLGNHGHLYNASTDPTTFVCSGCHPSLGTKPATFPPLTGFGQTGWCFRCHNGPGGPGQGFVDPLGLAPSVTPTPILVSAITPTSRNAVVGTPVTLFMSVINGGTATATNVGITQASSLPVTVSYTPWNGTAFTGPA